MRPGTPLVVATHVPLVSGVLQIAADPWKTAETYLVTNSREVLEVLWPYRPKAVLQGHTHIRETILYDGCRSLPRARSAETGGRVLARAIPRLWSVDSSGRRNSLAV